jgi:hypothetical protein
MKTILIATLALGVAAGSALAAGFPEKAESRVATSSQNYAGDLMIKLPLKKADQIHSGSYGQSFGSSEALSVNTGSVAPIFSPNR